MNPGGGKPPLRVATVYTRSTPPRLKMVLLLLCWGVVTPPLRPSRLLLLGGVDPPIHAAACCCWGGLTPPIASGKRLLLQQTYIVPLKKEGFDQAFMKKGESDR